jgi:hypothetical protein
VKNTIIKNNDGKNNPPDSAAASGEVLVIGGIEGPQELSADGSPSGVEIDQAGEPYPFDVEKISISNKKISLSNVIRRLGRGLIHASELQRRENLWDIGRKSRLIESLMLKIPLPCFYAAATRNDELFIVDGLQRISTIRRYAAENGFALQGLEFLREFEGKKFETLPERMRIRIEETELDFVIIDPDSPQAVQRNIFKRLNTGGMPLTEQEIRHALYYGPVTELLKELVETEEFQAAVARSVNDSRMAAQELVLRFFAFSVMGTDQYRKDEEMDSFLSDAMQIINNLKNHYTHMEAITGTSSERKILNRDIDSIRKKFIISLVRARELFDNCAFRISTPLRKNRTPINKSLFELWSILLSDMSGHDFDMLKMNKGALYEALEGEFSDTESNLKKFIGKDSTKAAAVRGRYEIIRGLINKIIKEGTQ